jgi:hypothetical protein
VLLSRRRRPWPHPPPRHRCQQQRLRVRPPAVPTVVTTGKRERTLIILARPCAVRGSSANWHWHAALTEWHWQLRLNRLTHWHWHANDRWEHHTTGTGSAPTNTALRTAPLPPGHWHAVKRWHAALSHWQLTLTYVEPPPILVVRHSRSFTKVYLLPLALPLALAVPPALLLAHPGAGTLQPQAQQPPFNLNLNLPQSSTRLLVSAASAIQVVPLSPAHCGRPVAFDTLQRRHCPVKCCCPQCHSSSESTS